jgi:hypothetical protein
MKGPNPSIRYKDNPAHVPIDVSRVKSKAIEAERAKWRERRAKNLEQAQAEQRRRG